jgi:uncharacterized protein YcgL (UPF0745 family)
MQAYVYKSRRKSDTYVYLRERDGFGLIPESLRTPLGALDFVLELTLGPDRKLAREDAAVVRSHLAARGFHLQFPPPHDGAPPAPFIENPSDMAALSPTPAPASNERGTAAELRDEPMDGDTTHGDA